MAGVGMIVVPIAVAVLWLTTPGGLQADWFINVVFAIALAGMALAGAVLVVRAWNSSEAR
jgi:hypothetical protein